MIQPFMKPILSGFIAVVAAFAVGGCANNSAKPNNSKTGFPTSEISRKVLERTDIPGSDEELRLMLVEFPAHSSSVPHIHPVGGLCYVVEGQAESQYEGDELKTIHAGDSYQDLASRKHVLFRNASDTDPLKFICTAKIRKDQQFMVPVP